MAEWLKAHAWKACIGETLSRVRIPLSPPGRPVFKFIKMTRNYSLIITLLLGSAGAFAQTATLGGQVADETGAVVPGAKITISGAATKSVTADKNGLYSVATLPLGSYSVVAAAPDLAMQPVTIVLKGGSQTLNLQLKVAATVQQVTVQESAGPVLSTDSSSNAGH